MRLLISRFPAISDFGQQFPDPSNISVGPDMYIPRSDPDRLRRLYLPHFDVMAEREDPTLSAAALARITYGSFSTAWRVRRDFGLLAGTSSRGSSFPAHRAKPAKSA
jgi:hypothetical protein